MALWVEKDLFAVRHQISDRLKLCCWAQPLPHARGSHQSPERQRAGDAVTPNLAGGALGQPQSDSQPYPKQVAGVLGGSSALHGVGEGEGD